MAAGPRARFRRLSPNKLIPNMLTVLALCAGLTAIRFGLQDRWELAVACIVLAGILDGLDGRLARLLGGTSRFGAELDSLSDFACFGFAPAILLYFWSLDQAAGLGWPLALSLAVCCALRLARFNVSLDEDDRPPWAARYFTGVPAPAGAGLAIMPMMLEFEFANGVFRDPMVVGPWTVTVALLMVSRIPTVSLKSFKVPQKFVLPTLMFVAVMAAFLAGKPWLTLTAVGVLYLASIPVSVVMYQVHKRRSGAEEKPPQVVAENVVNHLAARLRRKRHPRA
ncbi:MAG: CDP-alcohol phosphatidyltransferase family protein [Kiloniellales bacterium]